jgi:hypothetical protein
MTTVTWVISGQLFGCGPAFSPADRGDRELAVYRALLDSLYQTSPATRQAAEILLREHFESPDTIYQAELMQVLRDSVPGLPGIHLIGNGPLWHEIS